MANRRSIVLGCCLFVIFSQMVGQNVIRLWSGDAPGARGTAPKDVPTLTVYTPDTAVPTGTGILICPGGGYGHLATRKEGEDYARFLAMHGVTGFVLKYRLGSDGYRYPEIFYDVQRALRIVRARSSEWHVDPHRIGVMGSSAGGHLASTLLTHYDEGNPNAADAIERVSCRPDFGILCYPVITMGSFTHEGSKMNLLGENPSQMLVDLLSNEKHVSAETPPCFLWQTAEDNVVSVRNSLAFAEALAESKVPFALHIYERGGHGLGLGDTYPFVHALPWTGELLGWLKTRKLITD